MAIVTVACGESIGQSTMPASAWCIGGLGCHEVMSTGLRFVGFVRFVRFVRFVEENALKQRLVVIEVADRPWLLYFLR